MFATILLCALSLERLAQIDNFDFFSVYDIESKKGTCDILDHVRLTGADTMMWRVNSGTSPRFADRDQSLAYLTPPVNRLRIPDPHGQYTGWQRLFAPAFDTYRFAMEECARRKLGKCAYWPYEENHWAYFTLGEWNLDHPQYWCQFRDGRPWHGRCSIAWPEVRECKLRFLDQILSGGCDTLYIEAFRTGNWDTSKAYVKPHVDAWCAQYPGEDLPKPDDPRWRNIVWQSNLAFFRGVRARLDASGRKIRFLFGIYEISKSSDPTWTKKAIDWRAMVREGIVDGIIVTSVAFDEHRPLESTRELYEYVKKDVAPKQFFVPVSAYDYQHCSVDRYARLLGVSKGEATAKLMNLAGEVGATGVILECVDYQNYTPEMATAIRDFGKQ